VLLEKNGDQLNPSCEKLKSITQKHGEEECPVYIERNKANLSITSCVTTAYCNALLKER